MLFSGSGRTPGVSLALQVGLWREHTKDAARRPSRWRVAIFRVRGREPRGMTDLVAGSPAEEFFHPGSEEAPCASEALGGELSLAGELVDGGDWHVKEVGDLARGHDFLAGQRPRSERARLSLRGCGPCGAHVLLKDGAGSI